MNLTATDIKTTVIFRLYDAVDTLNKLPLSFDLDRQKLIKCTNKADDHYLRKMRFDFFSSLINSCVFLQFPTFQLRYIGIPYM
ncbi:hypothetical protein H4V97_001947 [Flavobacterium sp. CG_23.5]|nr:hypothetical protein [Flavobacterium sp. CG_23.5]